MKKKVQIICAFSTLIEIVILLTYSALYPHGDGRIALGLMILILVNCLIVDSN